MAVVSGAALHPAVREYERTTFALLNAYVTGAFAGIEQLSGELADRGQLVRAEQLALMPLGALGYLFDLADNGLHFAVEAL